MQADEAAHRSSLRFCEATLEQQRLLGAAPSYGLVLEELEECAALRPRVSYKSMIYDAEEMRLQLL